MLAENTTIHLSRGRHTLTIAKLRGRFVGLIDGHPYIASTNPDHVVRYLVQTSADSVREWRRAMKKAKRHCDGSPVEAAKRFAGDAEEDAISISDEEEAAMAELRREYQRPSQAEIRKEAARLWKK